MQQRERIFSCEFRSREGREREERIVMLCVLQFQWIKSFLSASKLFGCDQMIRTQGSDWRASWLQLHCRLFSGTRSHCFSNIA